MKKRSILFGLLSLILVLVLVIPATSCIPKRTTTTPEASSGDYVPWSEFKELRDKVNSLPDSSDTGDFATQEDLQALEDELYSIYEALDDTQMYVDDAIAAFEEEQADSTNSSNSNSNEVITTRWIPTIEFDPALDDERYTVSVDWYPTRIKEEDTYRFTINITAVENQDEVVEVNALWISFNPVARDTYVDISNTGIYSVKPLNIWWDVEYSPSNGKDCRSMVFVSDDFEIPKLGKGETYPIRFDFDLYYAD